MTITDYHAKLYAHELQRRHSTTDPERLTGTLFDARIDLAPHQVEAALFAFQSPLSSGAILADEVGLGKTIEAGMLLAQKWAEGKRRILIITPANLRKQWSQEMEEKFFMPTLILESRNYKHLAQRETSSPFVTPALVICSLQFAARHAGTIMTIGWDLVVIDEAHRVRNSYRPDNKMGRSLKAALANVPKVLLTATPLQNSVMELYGLVSFVDDFAFGDAKSFQEKYSRMTRDEQYTELRQRLLPICHRTLRRQVLQYIRYTNRLPLTQEFVPSEPERVLYDAVSAYLQRPTLEALPKAQRKLTTLVMRKLLASSTFAIAGTLETLARRLRRQLANDKKAQNRPLTDELSEDYEGLVQLSEEWKEHRVKSLGRTAAEIEALEEELAELQRLRDFAVSITENAKGEALLKALATGFARARELGSAEKVIIFTESRRTQDYLQRHLSENGYDGRLLLFNGANADPVSKEIFEAWSRRHAGSDRITDSRTADMRAALVDYFREEATIMIATEAAAEGINLQFCSMVVNYDLPWNPQRIEQRIGRCHRYGQAHDVVVINFLDRENAADQRVYELLGKKFKLFSGVFGASDEVLGAIESGVAFEERILSIYQTCRTTEEIESAFQSLRRELDGSIEAAMAETRRRLLEHFDVEVHDRLKIDPERSHASVDRYGRMLWQVTRHELGPRARFDNDDFSFALEAIPDGLDVSAGRYALGRDVTGGHRYRFGHSLAKWAVARAAERELGSAELVFDYSKWPQRAAAIQYLVGKAGTLVAHKLGICGADDQDHLVIAAVTDDSIQIDAKTVMRLFELPVSQSDLSELTTPDAVRQAIQAERQRYLDEHVEREADWFEAETTKLDAWAKDRRESLGSSLEEIDAEIGELKNEIRRRRTLPEKLALTKNLNAIERKRDDARRAYDESCRRLEGEKDLLVARAGQRLGYTVSDEALFAVRFKVF